MEGRVISHRRRIFTIAEVADSSVLHLSDSVEGRHYIAKQQRIFLAIGDLSQSHTHH